MSGNGASQGSDMMRRIKEDRIKFQEAMDGAKAVSTAGGKDLLGQIMSENVRIREDLASISQEREEALARAEAAMQERHKAEKTIAQLEAQLKGSSEGGQYGTLGAAAGGGGGGRSPGLESVDEEHGEEVWLRERLGESEKEGERLRADLEQSKKLWDEGSQIWHEAEKEIQETKEQIERLVAVADAAERARCDALEQASAERKLLESLREQVQHDQEVSRKIVRTVKAENVRLEKERRHVEELHRADKDSSIGPIPVGRTEQQDAETLTKITTIEAEVVRLVQELRSSEEARGSAAARAALAESERDMMKVRIDEMEKMSLAKDAEFCKEVERMQRETAELKLQLSAANKRVKEQEKDAADLKSQISAAHSSLAEAASKAEEAALQVAAKVEEAAAARINDELASYKAKITSLEFLHGQSVDELEVKKSEVHELEDEVKRVKSRCREAEASVVKIRCSLMTMSQEMDEEKEAAGRFRDQVMRLEKEEGQLREEVMRLERELDASRGQASDNEALKAAAKVLNVELLASRKECADAVKEIGTLRDAVANAEQGLEDARLQSREAIEVVEKRDAALRKCEASLESCASELEQAKVKLREAEAQARSASEKLVEVSLEHAEAEKRSKAYFEEEMGLVGGSHANELAKMEALVNQKIETRREAERERDAAVSESESLRSERDAAISHLSESERTIREYGESSNSRLLALQDRVVELEGEVAAAADKLREVERDRDLTVKEAAGKEADRGKDKAIKGLNARVEALQRHVEMVSSDLGSESARAQDLSERLTKVEEQLCQERDAHRLALEEGAEKLRLGVENAARDVRVIEKRMEEREEEVANLNVEISQMREREITCLREATRERSELKDRAAKAEVDAHEREKGLEVERQRGVVLAEELKAKIENLEAEVKRASEAAEQASRLCSVERAKVESLSEKLVIVEQQKAMRLQSIQALEAKLEEKDLEVGVLKACKAEVEESAKKKEGLVNKLLEEIKGAGTKSAENQGLVSDLRAAVAERDAEIERRAAAEAHKVAGLDARVAELMKEVQEGEARVKELEMGAMRKDQLSQQVIRLEAELETAKTDLTNAKNFVVEAQAAARAAEIDWDKRVNELESELREARTDVEDMDRQLYQAQQEAEGNRGEASEREKEKEKEAEWKKKVEALMSEAKEREGEIEKLEQEVASLMEAAAEANSGIRDEVLRLSNVKQVLASELEAVKASRRESEVALSATEAELAKSQAECMTLTTEIKVIGGNLEREVSRLADLEAGWKETKRCLAECEFKLEEERKTNAATGAKFVAEMRVREAKIESVLKELEEAKAAASRAAHIEGSHQELMSLLAEKESIISQLTLGKGSKPPTAVEIAKGGQETGIDAESARDTRRNLEMACTSIVECIEVLEGAASDKTVKEAVHRVKSQALSFIDGIHSDWGEVVEWGESRGERGNSNSINGGNIISSSSDGDESGSKATFSASQHILNLSQGLVSVARGLASAMTLHKAEAERGLAPMLVQAIVGDVQRIRSSRQKEGDEGGREEADSSDTRIETLRVQVSRLMAVMESLREVDADAMRRLEARWQSRVQGLQELLEKRGARMDAEVVKRDYALLKAQKQLISVQGQLSQAQQLLLQQRTTNACVL